MILWLEWYKTYKSNYNKKKFYFQITSKIHARYALFIFCPEFFQIIISKYNHFLFLKMYINFVYFDFWVTLLTKGQDKILNLNFRVITPSCI